MAKNASANSGKNSRPAGPASVSKAALKEFLARALELLDPILASMGLELVRAQCPIEGGRAVLRLFIDRPPVDSDAKNGTAADISLDDCAAVSRALDEALEADSGPQPDDYTLEVSSPGLDRPLVKETDFDRFQGRLVKMKLRRGDKTSGHKGRLGRNAVGGLALVTEDGPLDFHYDEVISCRLSLEEIVF